MQSHYDLSFQVTEGSSFTLFSTAIFEFPAATLSITLFDPNGVALVDEDRSGAGTPVVSEVGVVVPGLHRLLIELTRTGSTSEILPGAGYSLNFDLSFTPIPEPSAAALLMLGLVALARRR
jgi:hypothetical protein